MTMNNEIVNTIMKTIINLEKIKLFFTTKSEEIFYCYFFDIPYITSEELNRYILTKINDELFNLYDNFILERFEDYSTEEEIAYDANNCKEKEVSDEECQLLRQEFLNFLNNYIKKVEKKYHIRIDLEIE